MSQTSYDAIVVGARCAGSPTAMLLARKGYRVLVVDRATYPSDPISTHLEPGLPSRCGPCRRDGVSAHPHIRLRHGAVYNFGIAGIE